MDLPAVKSEAPFRVQTDSVRPSTFALPAKRLPPRLSWDGELSLNHTVPAAFPTTSTPVVAAFSATRTLAPTTVPCRLDRNLNDRTGGQEGNEFREPK